MTTLTKISEYTLKAVTMSLTPGAAGSVIGTINFEGSAPGFGPVFGTMNVASPGQAAGTWDWCGATFPAEGEGIVGRATGAYTRIGSNRWSTRGTMSISDGRTVVLDGIVDLASRTWNGDILGAAG